MPLYLDVHHKIEGLSGDAVEDAHQKDLQVQHKHGVHYIRHWYDDGRRLLLAGGFDEVVSQRTRKRVEEIFDWLKTIGLLAQDAPPRPGAAELDIHLRLGGL